MAKPKIKWDVKTFEEIRKRDDVKAAVTEIAEKIADACGDGYVAESSIGTGRARAAVITATGDAIRDNAANNTILANISAGRS